MQQHDTKLDTNPPQFDGGTEPWDKGISPETKAQQIHSLAQSMLFRTTPPPWNLTDYPKCTPDDSPVSVQQHDP